MSAMAEMCVSQLEEDMQHLHREISFNCTLVHLTLNFPFIVLSLPGAIVVFYDYR